MAFDKDKIKLNGERSEGIVKYINNLSKWKFFQVLYSNSMFRMMLTNLLMLVFVLPAVYFSLAQVSQISQLGLLVPLTSSIGIGYAPWQQLDSFIISQREIIRDTFIFWLVPSVTIIALAISGGFAVVRDSFWTGKIRVLKTFFKGIANTFYITIPCMAAIAGIAYGIFYLYLAMTAAMALWLAIIILVIILIIFAIFIMYLFILFGVVTAHKQPILDSLATSWHLLLLNKLPNIINFILAVLPIGLVFLASGLLTTLILAFYIMFGAFYTAYIWMCHMMKTFALFNPVERKRIK